MNALGCDASEGKHGQIGRHNAGFGKLFEAYGQTIRMGCGPEDRREGCVVKTGRGGVLEIFESVGRVAERPELVGGIAPPPGPLPSKGGGELSRGSLANVDACAKRAGGFLSRIDSDHHIR